MIGLDTNVVVRLFVEDDAAQAVAARRAVERFTEEDPGFISLAVLAETAWVLDRIYRFPPLAVADAVEGLLKTETFVVQNSEQVYLAVEAVRSGSGSFADVLVGALSQWAGCDTTLTFDVKASRLDGFTRVLG
jgi:predicted nucleic-acid-binding protein